MSASTRARKTHVVKYTGGQIVDRRTFTIENTIRDWQQQKLVGKNPDGREEDDQIRGYLVAQGNLPLRSHKTVRDTRASYGSCR
ncbi:hypothetical protein KKJ05_13085 [Xenorhabdus bovienii]|nr:hypothetical protein [Xenorhabdus bovienii]